MKPELSKKTGQLSGTVVERQREGLNRTGVGKRRKPQHRVCKAGWRSKKVVCRGDGKRPAMVREEDSEGKTAGLLGPGLFMPRCSAMHLSDIMQLPDSNKLNQY